MDLEQKLKKLEELAELMEDESVTLEKSLEAFAQSVTIADDCMKQLSEYKGKLTILQDKLKKNSDENR